MNDSADHFFKDFGRMISELSGDSQEGSFIFPRLSVTIQRSNAALFGSTSHSLGTCTSSHSTLLLIFSFFLTNGPILPGVIIIINKIIILFIY